MPAIKILFLAANPRSTDRLALDNEVREITTKIRASEYRDALDLITQWAVQPDDLLHALNQHTPHIVHFSGHGTEHAIILAGRDGQARPVSTEALDKTFRALADNIRVVVLNACYSRAQAEALVQHIDCVIGMRNAVPDEHAASLFSASFYRAIGFGRSVENAFEQGRAALAMEGVFDHIQPELLVRDGVNAGAIHLIEPTTAPSSRASETFTAASSARPADATPAGAFDVFLCHNSSDKPVVREIGEALRQRGLRVWLDEWELVPGRPWQDALEDIIQTVRSAAILVARDGLGPWTMPEMRACLQEFVRRALPVIPVLLPGAAQEPALPLFLQQFAWVDLRAGIAPGGLDRLEWGITGRKPAPRR